MSFSTGVIGPMWDGVSFSRTESGEGEERAVERETVLRSVNRFRHEEMDRIPKVVHSDAVLLPPPWSDGLDVMLALLACPPRLCVCRSTPRSILRAWRRGEDVGVCGRRRLAGGGCHPHGGVCALAAECWKLSKSNDPMWIGSGLSGEACVLTVVRDVLQESEGDGGRRWVGIGAIVLALEAVFWRRLATMRASSSIQTSPPPPTASSHGRGSVLDVEAIGRLCMAQPWISVRLGDSGEWESAMIRVVKSFRSHISHVREKWLASDMDVPPAWNEKLHARGTFATCGGHLLAPSTASLPILRKALSTPMPSPIATSSVPPPSTTSIPKAWDELGKRLAHLVATAKHRGKSDGGGEGGGEGGGDDGDGGDDGERGMLVVDGLDGVMRALFGVGKRGTRQRPACLTMGQPSLEILLTSSSFYATLHAHGLHLLSCSSSAFVIATHPHLESKRSAGLTAIVEEEEDGEDGEKEGVERRIGDDGWDCETCENPLQLLLQVRAMLQRHASLVIPETNRDWIEYLAAFLSLLAEPPIRIDPRKKTKAPHSPPPTSLRPSPSAEDGGWWHKVRLLRQQLIDHSLTLPTHLPLVPLHPPSSSSSTSPLPPECPPLSAAFDGFSAVLDAFPDCIIAVQTKPGRRIALRSTLSNPTPPPHPTPLHTTLCLLTIAMKASDKLLSSGYTYPSPPPLPPTLLSPSPHPPHGDDTPPPSSPTPSSKSSVAGRRERSSSRVKIGGRVEVSLDSCERIPKPPSPSYVLGTRVPFSEDETHEFKAAVGPPATVARVIPRLAPRYLVSFLNGRGGTLYFGIADDGRVEGVVLPRAEADQLRTSLDRVRHTRVGPPGSWLFIGNPVLVPVVMEEKERSGKESGGDEWVLLRDVVVIEIPIYPSHNPSNLHYEIRTLTPGGGRPRTVEEHTFWLRHAASTRKLTSPQELAEWGFHRGRALALAMAAERGGKVIGERSVAALDPTVVSTSLEKERDGEVGDEKDGGEGGGEGEGGESDGGGKREGTRIGEDSVVRKPDNIRVHKDGEGVDGIGRRESKGDEPASPRTLWQEAAAEAPTPPTFQEVTVELAPEATVAIQGPGWKRGAHSAGVGVGVGSSVAENDTPVLTVKLAQVPIRNGVSYVVTDIRKGSVLDVLNMISTGALLLEVNGELLERQRGVKARRLLAAGRPRRLLFFTPVHSHPSPKHRVPIPSIALDSRTAPSSSSSSSSSSSTATSSSSGGGLAGGGGGGGEGDTDVVVAGRGGAVIVSRGVASGSHPTRPIGHDLAYGPRGPHVPGKSPLSPPLATTSPSSSSSSSSSSSRMDGVGPSPTPKVVTGMGSGGVVVTGARDRDVRSAATRHLTSSWYNFWKSGQSKE